LLGKRNDEITYFLETIFRCKFVMKYE